MTTAATTQGLERDLSAWKRVFITGLLFGGLALYVTLVGIVGTFEDRAVIRDVITVGQAVLLLTAFGAGYIGARRAPQGPTNAVVGAAIAGAMSGAALSLLILVGPALDLREYLPNASPRLYDLIAGVDILGVEDASWRGDTFPVTFWFPALVGMGLGVLGGVLTLLPRHARVLIMLSAGVLILMGLFSSIIRNPWLQQDLLKDLARQLFASDGLTIIGAALVLGIVILAYLAHVLLRPAERVRRWPRQTKRVAAIPMSTVLLIIVLLIPLPATLAGLPNVLSLGPFVASAVALIAVYALMGLGLNITLGLAGLLDLGFVAFFAVGAYTVGLLTSVGEFGVAQWPFWLAIPFAVLVAMGFGIFLGLPILGIRGDYLAIATLGFGEIIAILARSDLLKPFIGGPRGILNIPAPVEVAAGDPLSRQVQIYFISLVCAAVIAFVAYRLRDSRLGRAWVAIREDEDVAEALGINLVQTKSLAYMLGAAFAGLGGAVFAALFGSIISSSININVSILVVTVIIIGGMGSIPGVVLGAIFIIGLPELFREFAEYRFLLYGIALILVMHWRPEGLMPSKVGQRELHQEDEVLMEGESGDPSGPSAGAASGAAAASGGGGA
jgi:branched-chain amino acid transport system permease protein